MAGDDTIENRRREVARMRFGGMTGKAIAEKLGVSTATVALDVRANRHAAAVSDAQVEPVAPVMPPRPRSLKPDEGDDGATAAFDGTLSSRRSLRSASVEALRRLIEYWQSESVGKVVDGEEKKGSANAARIVLSCLKELHALTALPDFSRMEAVSLAEEEEEEAEYVVLRYDEVFPKSVSGE